jgi:hypothetical protein
VIKFFKLLNGEELVADVADVADAVRPEQVEMGRPFRCLTTQ